jgi:hypothetical protein
MSSRFAATVAANKPPNRRTLAGGNPRIAKADGNAPVTGRHRGHAGLKTRRRARRRLDALIARAVLPSSGLRKAVKWNPPS